MSLQLNTIQKEILRIMMGRVDRLSTQNEMVEKLAELGGKGAKRASVVLCTTPKTRKDCPIQHLKKISYSLVDLNLNYENKVNTLRSKEGKEQDFKSSTSWHKNILTEKGKLTPFVKHPKTNDVYLRAILNKNIETIYVDESTGKIVEKEFIEPHIIVSKSKRQGLDNSAKYFTPKIENIKGITVGGECLLIV